MKHAYAADCHNHSFCSPDGKHSPQAMVDRAKELGLYVYTMTDHCECNDYEGQYRERSKNAWREMEKLHIPEGLRFYRGIELGQPMQNLEGAKEAAARYPYDFIIGSLHNMRDYKDFYYLDCRQKSREEVDGLLHEYWTELLEMISWGGFDSLGHLTYPLRYIQGEQGVPVDLSSHMEHIEAVFSALIQKEIALEVNTSGLYGKLGATMPGPELLRQYRALGGKLVTLGSDAHCTENLAKGIDEGMELLKAAGFTEFAVFEKRKPVMLPLE